jgi:hypothetical protein
MSSLLTEPSPSSSTTLKTVRRVARLSPAITEDDVLRDAFAESLRPSGCGVPAGADA